MTHSTRFLIFNIFTMLFLFNPDSILYIVGISKTVESNYTKAALLANRGQFSSAISLLDSMQIHYKITAAQYLEMNGLKDLYNLLGTVDSRGLTIAELDSADVVSLKSIAEDNDAGIAGQKARNALCFHYQICYDAQGNPKNSSTPRKPKPNIEELMSLLNTANAYPNPSDQFITIAYTLLNAKESTILNILDPLGRMVESRNLGKVYEGQQLIDTRKLANGIYFFQISQEGNVVSDGKFIIAH